eukprot:633217-Heterocapsa_arctica.AAC.1
MCEAAVQLRAKEARDAQVELRVAQITDTEMRDSPPHAKPLYEIGEQSDEMKRQHDEVRERRRL